MNRPDVIVLMTDEERAAPPYETDELRAWRREALTGAGWFDDHGVSFDRHYTGSLACVPSRPTLFTGQYPDLHGVTQTDGLGKMADDSRMRWLPPHEVPTLGNWFRAAGYDTHYDGKWHISHADLHGDDGQPLPTNTATGDVIEDNVRRYLDENPLDPYGFSGWVGPEPHGGLFANSGLARDALIAERVVAWLDDRYARRRAGDADAQRPFLLVASFVNPHDIVLFPLWMRRGMPEELAAIEVPSVPPAPSASEDLRSKPAAHVAYRAAYPSCYGPPAAVAGLYRNHAQEYRDLYYRLHAAVDRPLDRVRRAVTEHTTGDAVLVRTSDHGELLGAHGGLHQKWFQLYDEATRIPFSIARVGSTTTEPRRVTGPTSHVDLVPTLLAAAGIDEATTADRLRADFSEVHPLPGRNLLPVVDGAAPDDDRIVYVMTRDNMPEGDTGANAIARAFGRADDAPGPLRIQVAAHVATNFEGVVGRVPTDVGGAGDEAHLWKLVRTFDDPATWTEPGVRQLASDGIGGPRYRTDVLPDQWELYDLSDDGDEMVNRADDPAAAEVFAWLVDRMKEERHRSIPERNQPWPYVTSRITRIGKVPLLPPRGVIEMQIQQRRAARANQPRPPQLVVRRLLQRLGLHPDDPDAEPFDLAGTRALVIATNHGRLDLGKPTGVFASELTVPYYLFRDAGMTVDVASPNGGDIPVDPQSLKPVIRTSADDRLLGDAVLREQLADSLAVGELDMSVYDIVFLAGGWGAAFDLGTSAAVGRQISAANELGRAIGGVCHGPLGLLRATTPEGTPLVAGRRVSAVTDKQVRELGIESTPQHPETELRAAGALFECAHAFRDPFANHWVVDGNLVTGQNQNAAPMVARELMRLIQ